ncbi:DUF6894 family protein [Sphingomonas turrisvirgatae]|uniref:DUF6894 domain-containing protein n=1 Tax=Sphingomonas turrisvirgatae TaxID=1888892 RepID=A0A1E3LVF6_9SPHN|nr:hypothetical protein [Sphingomonas turrisvirgatae]ODP37699.1 hypothetical protein BFL28_01590 [Sphingomonas turrisvirgatae]
MPLFYFHRRDAAACPDDVRCELRNLDEALAEANRIARTAIARAADPMRLRREALDIENESRSVVARVMFADVLQSTAS